MESERISVLYVEDNRQVAESVALLFRSDSRFRWVGWTDGENLSNVIRDASPDIVIVDLDLPGCDAFDGMRAIAESAPRARVIVFSGRLHPESIDRAVDAGAWGFVAKSDGGASLVEGVIAVSRGDFTMSPGARAIVS